MGLVGRNGVGKSTLLLALCGRMEPDSGSVDLAPSQATVGLLAQEPERSTGETVRHFIHRRTGVLDAQHALDAATECLALGRSGADDRYSAALDRWLGLGAADLDARIAVTASDLGIAVRLLDQPMASLSGGEAARCALASVMLSRYDILLLDEPTNDLDIEGLDRLESWVLGLDTPLVVVSHDRTFLERTITEVAEIDEFTRRVSVFAGGWAAFRSERELVRMHARHQFDAYDEKRRRLQRRAQREREWAAQGRARVRRADEPDKNIRHFKLNQTEQLAGRAARTERAIERLDVAEEPRDPWELRFRIPAAGRSGDVVAELHDVTIDRGSFRFGPVTARMDAGDRIALVGANGSGKTTLIDLLAGRLAPDGGQLTLGASVVVGEVEQARQRLVSDRPLLDVVTAETGLTLVDARSLSAKFGLSADHVRRPASSLSPGERTRASLAVLMANGANLLVLDEPTNHLDVEAIEQLESALDGFEGTVVLVTHDRALLDNVRLDRRWEMIDGRLTQS
jgi:ATPase subunit of ABC transporter with duplicated ATPase domains